MRLPLFFYSLKAWLKRHRNQHLLIDAKMKKFRDEVENKIKNLPLTHGPRLEAYFSDSLSADIESRLEALGKNFADHDTFILNLERKVEVLETVFSKHIAETRMGPDNLDFGARCNHRLMGSCVHQNNHMESCDEEHCPLMEDGKAVVPKEDKPVRIKIEPGQVWMDVDHALNPGATTPFGYVVCHRELDDPGWRTKEFFNWNSGGQTRYFKDSEIYSMRYLGHIRDLYRKEE